MKKFKKISAGLLSLTLLACIGTSQAFAYDINSATEGSNKANKEAKVNVFDPADPEYRIDITWGALTYNITELWDESNHTLTHEWASTASGSDDKITVSSSSNLPAKATLSFSGSKIEGKPDYSAVNGQFSPSAIINLAKADGEAKTGSATMSLSGSPTYDTVAPATDDVIGTVTVTIEPAS